MVPVCISTFNVPKQYVINVQEANFTHVKPLVECGRRAEIWVLAVSGDSERGGFAVE